MGQRELTPKERIERLHRKREIYLFSEDEELISSLQAHLMGKDYEFLVVKQLKEVPDAQPLIDRAFIIDMSMERLKPEPLIEGLEMLESGFGKRALVITPDLIDGKTRSLVKRYAIQGYVPRTNLDDVLQTRLERMFNLGTKGPVLTIRTSTEVTLEWNGSSGQMPGICTSLSESEMFIQTPTPPPKEVGVRVRLTVPGERRPRLVNGKVAYSVQTGCSVALQENGKELVRLIRHANRGSAFDS